MKAIEDWDQVLEMGFNFIIDVNVEYDVKNFIEKGLERSNEYSPGVTLYKQSNDENDGEFEIRLKTISMS